MTKPESLDCVALKQRAQRALARALAGKTAEQQIEILHRLAAETHLWRSFAKARAKRRTVVRSDRKRRATG
jgi:hypothetical protein